MKATRNGKLEAVKRLLAAGCSVAVRDRNSKFKLHRIPVHVVARSSLAASRYVHPRPSLPVSAAPQQESGML